MEWAACATGQPASMRWTKGVEQLESSERYGAPEASERVGLRGSYTLASEASLTGGPCQQRPWALQLR